MSVLAIEVLLYIYVNTNTSYMGLERKLKAHKVLLPREGLVIIQDNFC